MGVGVPVRTFSLKIFLLRRNAYFCSEKSGRDLIVVA